MTGEHRLDAVVLTVAGSPLDVAVLDRLTTVRVEESVHLPDVFVLRFDDPHFALFDDGVFTLGTPVEIALRAEGDPVTVTAGEVTALSVEQTGSGRHELVVQGLDATHRLGRTPRTHSYQQYTDADIAAQIADRYDLETDIDGTEEVHDYVLQAGQTDQAFLAARARRIGFDAWVSDGTLRFKAAPTSASRPPALVWGENLLRWRVRFSSAERSDEVVVRGWDARAKCAIEGRATAAGGEPGAAAAGGELAADARDAFGEVVRSAGRYPVETRAEADALARALLQRADAHGVSVRGEASGNPLLAAGADVDVERVGARMSGTYRLTSVEHVYGVGTAYVTRFTCGGREPAGLSDLLGPSAPGAAGAAPDGASRVAGLVVGIVTNVDDAEQLGRVKVSCPTLAGEDESCWARVVAPGAGPDRGLQCLPEVGDEVLVGFELDDPRRPLVLGGLWNREDAPPEPAAVVDGEVDARTWRSRLGHRLTLRDGRESDVTLTTADGSHVTLRDGGGAGIRIEAPEIEVAAERRLALTGQEVAVNGNRITIAADTELALNGTPIRLN